MISADRVVPSEFPYGRFALIVFIGAFCYAVVQETFAPIVPETALGVTYTLAAPYAGSITSFGVVLLLAGGWAVVTVGVAVALDQALAYIKPDLSDTVRYLLSLAIYGGVFVYLITQTVLFASRAL